MLCRLICAATILVLGADLSAAPPAKEPWKWTLDERLAKLLAPKERAVRAARRGGVERKSGGYWGAPSGELIDGKVNPELLLPTQLFRNFVWNCFTGNPAGIRHALQQRSDDLLLTPDEWAELEPIVADYAKTFDRENDLLALPKSKWINEQLGTRRLEQCRLLMRSLQATRKRYQGDRFDRYLYTVIAPLITRFAEDVAVNPDAVDVLRTQEKGCK